MVTGATNGSIMGGKNEQASLQSRNANRQIKNGFSNRCIGKSAAVTNPKTNTVAQNEADTNEDTLCLRFFLYLLPTPIQLMMATHTITPRNHWKMCPH